MGKSIKAIAAIILIIPAFIVAGCKPDVPNDGNDDNGNLLNGHEYVDLGLPSGILWATCNLGASQPEEFGDYYAWGETTTKGFYDWKTYKYSVFVDGLYKVNKYCSNPDNGLDGFVDTLTVLEPVDDAVRANWGDDWRMPTKEDWAELYQNTTCVWTTQNGVNGRLLTSWNGNSIFLPASGYCFNEEQLSVDIGIYWTSTLRLGSPISAWSFHFDMDYAHLCGTYERNRGQCVRAVRTAK